MFTLTKQVNIAEIIDSKRVYRDFLHVIEKIAFIFAEIYELQLKAIMNHEVQFIAIIDIFRHHMRMKKARKKKQYSIRHSSLTKTKNYTIIHFHFEKNNKNNHFVIATKNIHTTIVIT